MEDPNADLRRLLVGLIAVTLLIAAALLWILPGVSTSQSAVMWRGACGRIGIVVAALWMAMPTRTRPAAWAKLNPRSVAAVLLAAPAIRFPLKLLLPVAGILLIAGVFLRPRDRVPPAKRRDRPPLTREGRKTRSPTATKIFQVVYTRMETRSRQIAFLAVGLR